jgi:uncharacterized protein
MVRLDEERVGQLYTGIDAAHDFDHVLRVTRMAVKIAQAEGADVAVVHAAALLHDVPVETRPGEDGRTAHHLAAADFARRYLAERGMEPERIDGVVHAIQAHRYRDQSIQPQTLEARCLYDADKLDSMGAIGVARVFAFAGLNSARLWTQPVHAAPPDHAQPEGAEYTPMHEFVYKLQRLLPTLHTQTARQMGQARHDFMVAFFAQLDREMEGL